jgi:hypothetical protein
MATAMSRDGSAVTAAPTAVHSALVECRLIVVGAPDLSTLEGTRAGMIDVTL